jgi:hypothetical protein
LRSTISMSVPAFLPCSTTFFFFEALVDQGLLHRVALPGDTVQQGDAGGVLVRGGGQDDAVDDEAQHVHGQASLPARHPFRGIPARRRGRDSDGSVDALRVQDHQARVG